ncbi:MAG: class I SAM-dependent methyltransferase [SAR324 cluster bacterium]|nr:class I SAM-dependent methyltransferase [SAR324 cluster bacterium]
MTDLFEEKAKDWDTNDMVTKLSGAIGKSILTQIELNSAWHVMDFGAGTGLITSQIAPHVNKITAIDVSQSMLEQLIAKDGLKDKVDILCQNILDCPTGENYDLIMSAMAMHHVEDTNKMLEQFSAHLKKGGQVALADLDFEDGTFHPEGVEGVYHDGFKRVEFQTMLENHGFSNVNFFTAHTAQKETGAYPIFLAVATKA